MIIGLKNIFFCNKENTQMCVSNCLKSNVFLFVLTLKCYNHIKKKLKSSQSYRNKNNNVWWYFRKKKAETVDNTTSAAKKNTTDKAIWGDRGDNLLQVVYDLCGFYLAKNMHDDWCNACLTAKPHKVWVRAPSVGWFQGK